MRYSDGSYDNPNLRGDSRPCHPTCIDEYERVVLVEHNLYLVRDLEVGNRVSELWMDVLEDVDDIVWWATEAQLEATFKL